jgi:hypothetical protein
MFIWTPCAELWVKRPWNPSPPRPAFGLIWALLVSQDRRHRFFVTLGLYNAFCIFSGSSKEGAGDSEGDVQSSSSSKQGIVIHLPSK